MRRLPFTVQTLVTVVVAGGIACLLVRIPDVADWDANDVAMFGLLAVGIVLAERVRIRVALGGETLNVSLTEALWVGALLQARPSVLAVAVAAGVLVGHAMRRSAPHKIAFNVGQFLLSLTAAQVVVAALRSPGLLRPANLMVIGLAMAVYAAINAGLVALVISRVQRVSFSSVILPPLPGNVVHFAANTAIGVAAFVMWLDARWATPVLVLPLVMSFFAYRVLLGTVEDGHRMRALVHSHS